MSPVAVAEQLRFKADQARLRSILREFDPAEVGELARIESRNREVVVPPVGVYRWWARRTEAVFGALVECLERSVGRKGLIADPFAGGGVIPLAAVIRGHQVYAQDINPWATLGLATMFQLPPKEELEAVLKALELQLRPLIDRAYGTRLRDGSAGVVSHTFRVPVTHCSNCGEESRLFTHAMVSLLARKESGKPEAFLACPRGHVFAGRIDRVARCPTCGVKTEPGQSYTDRRKVICPHCSAADTLATRLGDNPWTWEVVLVERASTRSRELDLPTEGEMQQADGAQWAPKRKLGRIPVGQETRVLRRHGFSSWEDLYPRRQLYVMEELLSAAVALPVEARVRAAAEMAIYGLAEMAGHISRWDRWYLKSYESMSGHRFNFTTFTAEPNVWGGMFSGRGTFVRRVRRIAKASEWISSRVGRDLAVQVPQRIRATSTHRGVSDVRIVLGDSRRMLLGDGVVDLVLTDPPYHDDVQYSELSALFRAWAQLGGSLRGEAVVNEATGRNATVEVYASALKVLFLEIHRILADAGHFVLSYHNRSPDSWIALFTALQGAGLYPAGYAFVHSENELDWAKKGVRACTMDLIMDLTKHKVGSIHSAPVLESTPETDFLEIVASAYRRVGGLPDGWQAELSQRLIESQFLRPVPTLESVTSATRATVLRTST